MTAMNSMKKLPKILFTACDGKPGDSSIARQQRKRHIEQIAHKRETEILQANAERNAGFFDTEMGKLEKWAEDVKEQP